MHEAKASGSENKDKNKSDNPTQAKRWLEWATRPRG